MSRDDLKRRVQEATDIVQLIGQHVSLRARGREFIGLCPFHDDKNPSMNVVPAKQIFKCFACGAGGDVFSFVMDYHKMSFPEALKHLAERANITLPRYDGGRDGDGPSPRQRILAVNQQALEFYRKTLQNERAGAAIRSYIAQRGISDEMVSVFQVGAAPDEWDALAKTVMARKWDVQAFEQAGLIAQRSGGDGYYDKLRHRLIFPIMDNIGRPIAFGGRIVPGTKREDSSDAKYLNSPETPAFNKSSTLYGLHAAQKPIIDKRIAVIVEGYVDVVACHQNGFKNVVATLGTALTAEHAQLLRRFCDKVVLLFDADEAGQKAADRAVQVLFTEPLDIQIAVLPGEKDPADLFARADGAEIWTRCMETAVDAMEFQFTRVRAQYDAVDTVTGRQRIGEEYLQKLVQLGVHQLNPERRGLIYAQVAQLLGISPGMVQEQVRKTAPREARGSRESDEAQVPVQVREKGSSAERHLVGALLNQPHLIDAVLSDGRPISETLVAADFADFGVRAVFHALCEWLHENHELAASDFRSAFADEALLRLAHELQLEALRLVKDDADHPEVLAGQLEMMAAQNAGQMLHRRAEREYQDQKVEMRSQPANDIPRDERDLRRLEMAVQHAKSNPAARRVPRIVGRE